MLFLFTVHAWRGGRRGGGEGEVRVVVMKGGGEEGGEGEEGGWWRGRWRGEVRGEERVGRGSWSLTQASLHSPPPRD